MNPGPSLLVRLREVDGGVRVGDVPALPVQVAARLRTNTATW